MQPTFHSIAYFAQSEGAGHFYHYHKSVEEAIEPYIKKFHAYVPLNAHFAHERPSWKKWFTPFYNRKDRKKFWKDCVRLFRQPSTESRVFFIEFFGRRDFSLYSLAALLFSKKHDQIWVLYRDDLTTRRKKELRVIRFFSKLLKWKCKDRFVPLTDSELLADYYQNWFGKRPTVLPIPHVQQGHFPTQKKEHLICTWPGNPRPEKGSDEIAQLVEIEDPMSAKIELDISGATHFPPVKNQLNVHLRKVFLTEEEYFAALHRSDVVLLPYDPKKYKWRTSGIFVEAILAGKIPLVKEGSWLAHELKRFDLHELIIEWDKPDFFTALFSLVNNEKIVKKLEKMQQAYQDFHGEKNFSKILQQLLQS